MCCQPESESAPQNGNLQRFLGAQEGCLHSFAKSTRRDGTTAVLYPLKNVTDILLRQYGSSWASIVYAQIIYCMLSSLRSNSTVSSSVVYIYSTVYAFLVMCWAA
jgi:hypothetical protein